MIFVISVIMILCHCHRTVPCVVDCLLYICTVEYRHIYVRHRRVGVLGPHHSIASPCLEGLWGSILSWRERFHTPLTKYVFNPVRDVRNWVDTPPLHAVQIRLEMCGNGLTRFHNIPLWAAVGRLGPESVHTVDGQPVILDPHLTVHQGELDNGVEGDLQVG